MMMKNQPFGMKPQTLWVPPNALEETEILIFTRARKTWQKNAQLLQQNQIAMLP